MNHSSYRTADEISDAFPSMFTDSKIAQEFSVAKTKLRYLMVFGLSTYFEHQIKESVKQCNHFKVLFDDSCNSVLNKEQMDVMIRYFDERLQEMCTVYIGSQFLGRATALDLQFNLNAALANFDLTNLIQISMDGPNVNLKFFRDFVQERLLQTPSAVLFWTLVCAICMQSMEHSVLVF